MKTELELNLSKEALKKLIEICKETGKTPDEIIEEVLKEYGKGVLSD